MRSADGAVIRARLIAAWVIDFATTGELAAITRMVGFIETCIRRAGSWVHVDVDVFAHDDAQVIGRSP